MQLRIEPAALALLALGVALPAFSIVQSAQAEAAASARFAAPHEPVVLTRTVWRTLRDGQQIVVRRSYLLGFAVDGDGFMVTGQQLDTEVEAPPALAALARLEQGRVDTAAFPLRLDAAGMIRSGSAPTGGQARLDGASAARALIAGASLPPADQREGEAFIAAIAAQGGAVPWPLDLFNPRAANHTDRREIALPDGATGTLTVTLAAESQRFDGLPTKVSREVVSELGETRRVSREEWTFAPRTGP
jgi:hypothetical protein